MTRPAMHRGIFLAMFMFAACSGEDAGHDQFLRCTGSLTQVVPGFEPEVWKDQQVAVHIKVSTISFSGNAFRFGEDIPICTSVSGRDARSESYFDFDTSTCEPLGLNTHNRTFGTYNRVLSKLELTNTALGADMPLKGVFSCAHIDPKP